MAHQSSCFGDYIKTSFIVMVTLMWRPQEIPAWDITTGICRSRKRGAHDDPFRCKSGQIVRRGLSAMPGKLFKYLRRLDRRRLLARSTAIWSYRGMRRSRTILEPVDPVQIEEDFRALPVTNRTWPQSSITPQRIRREFSRLWCVVKVSFGIYVIKNGIDLYAYIYVYVWNMNAFDALGYLQLRRVDATTMTSVAIVAILRQVAVVALTSCSATRSVACARLAWYVRGCLIQWGKQMHYRPAKVWLIEAKRSWTVKFEKWITYCNYRTD